MKKNLLVFILSFLCINVYSQTLQWAKSTGGVGKDEGISITTDAAGNSYSIGSFRGTVDFDPGPGVTNLTSVGDNDIFVSKMDANGNLVWAKSFGSTVYDVGIDIAVDAAGNVYTTGNYSGSVDFDPGAGTTILTSAGASDIFISKLDAAGNFLFARSMGGSTVDGGLSIAVDASGNIYTTGAYSGTADFDPGAAVFSLSSLKAGDDIFVLKLNSSGNFLWARTAGGGNPDQGTAIAVDAAGNVYVTGFYAGDANFNPLGFGAGGLFTANGSNDFIIFKFDTAGIFTWARSIGGSGPDVGYGITVDALGNVYTTGYFFGTADFDPGAATFPLTSPGSNVDIFVSKLNPSGNFDWAKNMGGTSGDVGYSISLDATNNIYVYGAFTGTADFDPSAVTINATSAGLADVFILKLDAGGNYTFVRTFGGAGDDIGYAMSLDAAGNMYATGIYNGTADFDPSAAVFNLTSAGNQDIFNFKYGSATILPVTLINFEAAANGNDALLTWKTVTEINADKFEIERSNNGLLFHYIGEVKASGNSTVLKSYTYTDKNIGTQYAEQKLYYRFKQKDLDGRFTYSPVRSINFIHKNKEVIVYPNPTKNNLTIKATAAQIGSFYFITDQLGRQVERGKLVKISNTINLSQVAAGIYYLKVAGATTQTFEIVKQ